MIFLFTVIILHNVSSQTINKDSSVFVKPQSEIKISFPISFYVPIPFINSSVGTSIGFNKFIELSVIYNSYNNNNYVVNVLDTRAYYTTYSNDNKFKGYLGIGAGYILSDRYIISRSRIFPFLSCKGEYALGNVVSIGGEVKFIKNNMFYGAQYELLPMATVTLNLPDIKL